MLTLQWLKNMGGIKAIAEINEKKAKLIYSEIDLNPLFKGFAHEADRSEMNATFTLADESLKDTFDKMC
jgi:phosphoserine aminotransferase